MVCCCHGNKSDFCGKQSNQNEAVQVLDFDRYWFITVTYVYICCGLNHHSSGAVVNNWCKRPDSYLSLNWCVFSYSRVFKNTSTLNTHAIRAVFSQCKCCVKPGQFVAVPQVSRLPHLQCHRRSLWASLMDFNRMPHSLMSLKQLPMASDKVLSLPGDSLLTSTPAWWKNTSVRWTGGVGG